jgi:hypothetical protein
LGAVKGKIWLPLLLVAVFALSRVPGILPGNFSAAYALAFCAGVYFPGWFAWWLPLGALFGTDVLLNVFYYHASVFSVEMLIKTASFAGLVWLGRLFSARMSWLRLVCGGLLGAVLFYLVTNTASWLLDAGYAKSIAGLIQALTRGLPNYPPTWEFFRNTLLSGGLFTGLFVGAMKLGGAAESAREKEAGARAEEPDAEEAPEEAEA